MLLILGREFQSFWLGNYVPFQTKEPQQRQPELSASVEPPSKRRKNLFHAHDFATENDQYTQGRNQHITTPLRINNPQPQTVTIELAPVCFWNFFERNDVYFMHNIWFQEFKEFITNSLDRFEKIIARNDKSSLKLNEGVGSFMRSMVDTSVRLDKTLKSLVRSFITSQFLKN